MNRQQRRRLQKYGAAHRQMPKMHSAAHVQMLKLDTIKRTTAHAVKCMEAAIVMVLHDKFGFGKQRLHKAVTEINALFDSITDGYLSIDDMEQTIKEEYDITL